MKEKDTFSTFFYLHEIHTNYFTHNFVNARQHMENIYIQRTHYYLNQNITNHCIKSRYCLLSIFTYSKQCFSKPISHWFHSHPGQSL